MTHPYLSPEQVGTGTVRDICTSCGYPFTDPPPEPDDRECSHPERHRPT